MVSIEVVYALPEEQQLVQLNVAPETSARAVLLKVLEQDQITLTVSDASINMNELPIGVFGLIVADDYVMQEGDRLEIYRPLFQDPMERRRKVARQSE